MIRTMRTLLLPAVMLGIVVAVACGNGGQDESASFATATRGAPGAPAVAPAPAIEGFATGGVPVEVVVEKEVIREVAAGETAITQAVSPFPPRAPAPGLADRDLAEVQSVQLEAQVALVSQKRIIVRTVHMDLEVGDVAHADPYPAAGGYSAGARPIRQSPGLMAHHLGLGCSHYCARQD